jgi:hypothetical protein
MVFPYYFSLKIDMHTESPCAYSALLFTSGGYESWPKCLRPFDFRLLALQQALLLLQLHRLPMELALRLQVLLLLDVDELLLQVLLCFRLS